MVQGEAKLKGVLRLAKGSKVQLHGLNNSKELNGQVGCLLEFDSTKLRWGVELESGKKVALKMNNLIPLSTELEPAVEIPHLGPTPVNAMEQDQQQLEASQPARPVEAEAEPPEEAKPPLHPEALPGAAQEHGDSSLSTALDDSEWPVLPTSAEAKARAQTGCWWDGGSAAKRFTEQLIARDPRLLSCCLVPPKRFNDDDANEICDALEVNDICEELLASGHLLSFAGVERLAKMLHATKTLRYLSVGESSLGDLACVLFEGLAQNKSLTGLDMEHKGLTEKACHALSMALDQRQRAGVAPLATLRLSKNKLTVGSLAGFAKVQPPKDLSLCDCALTASHAKSLGEWAARGVEVLNLRDNSGFRGDGVELLMKGLASASLFSLRLDGCCIGDDGLESIAEALQCGLELEDLFIEHCEITVVGCEFLERALRGRRLRTLSVRANVIGDEGCIRLARCAARLDLSSTSLSGQILPTLGAEPLVALELFSNPALGPSVGAWCTALDSSQWQHLEYLDLTGCRLEDAGFDIVCNTLIERPDLMPKLKDLLIGANEIKEDDEKCELVDRVGASRGGRLSVKWLNT